VADDINVLAEASNDTAIRNRDFPALWQKRALENAAAPERADAPRQGVAEPFPLSATGDFRS
jgi:hypothetical protein